jgi:hypothetical protein
MIQVLQLEVVRSESGPGCQLSDYTGNLNLNVPGLRVRKLEVRLCEDFANFKVQVQVVTGQYYELELELSTVTVTGTVTLRLLVYYTRRAQAPSHPECQ